MASKAEILKRYWGYDAFRPMQEEIIDAVLDGQDTLALMPTGGGKSVCYQVPALMKHGIALVVSPLIALMKDQVENLRRRHIKAEALVSGMHQRDVDRILDNCIYGDVKILYLSPERLRNPLVRERIKRMQVSLLAVDEAHCISQWGYDFRPAYLLIADIRQFLPKSTPVLALTATATPEVARDIQDKLQFRKPKVLRAGFLRPNLSYSVFRPEDKEKHLIHIINRVPGPAIVYVPTRGLARTIAGILTKAHINADYYHAGLSAEERSRKQEAWKSGITRVMVATNAFGMGIDKADVRLVVHTHLPDSLEAYYQEAGRAGRDGIKAFAVLLVDEGDLYFLQTRPDIAFPSIQYLRKIYRALANYFQVGIGATQDLAFEFDLARFTGAYNLHPLKAHYAIKILQQEGWIHITDSYYLPASVKFKVGQSDIYRFIVEHPHAEQFARALLREVQGMAFDDYVQLRESALAYDLRMELKELQQKMRYLHKLGLIDYRPQTELPRLSFLRERIHPDNLTIDTKAYKLRKERYIRRVKFALQYVDSRECRSIFLNRYFGDDDTPPCGICDICLGRHHRQDPAPDEFREIRTQIIALLKKQRLDRRDIFAALPHFEYAKIAAVLTHLVNESTLKETASGFKVLSNV